MKRELYLITVFVGILFLWFANSGMANIVNPNFADADEDGIIDGWTHNEFVTSWSPSGSVQFSPDSERKVRDGFLSQIFTLDTGSTTLSFDGQISVPSETGIFTAALLDSEGGSLAGFPNPFFTRSTEQILPGDDHLDFTCSLDVSSLSGQEVKLVFNLNNDYPIDNPNDAYALLSNLTVAVPEPATMMLLGLGSVMSLISRKRKA
jgi:hypothetical protein